MSEDEVDGEWMEEAKRVQDEIIEHADGIVELLKFCNEKCQAKNMALVKLQELVMWANQAIFESTIDGGL